MTIKTITDHPYAQAHEYFYNDGAVALVSYTTTVITIDADGWLEVNGLYSRTTIKHIGWFMRERGLTYQLAKSLLEDGLKYNIYTAEVVAL